MSLPKKIEGFTVNGRLPRTKGEKVLGFFEHNLPTLFLLLLVLVLKGMQEKFSLGNETVLTRDCDAQDSQVPQLFPKLLPTE